MCGAIRQRNEYLDVLMGIGIVLVYLGHTVRWGTVLSRMIFNIHMPLFFIVSGILFARQQGCELKVCLRRLWRSLLIPYLFFCLINALIRPEVTVLRWSKDPVGELVRVVHGEGGSSIWFLMCLASVQLIAWALRKTLKDKWYSWKIRCAILLSCLLLAQLCKYISWDIASRCPAMIISVPSGLFFFVAGSFANQLAARFEVIRLRLCNEAYVAIVIGIVLLASSMCSCRTFDLRMAVFDIRALPMCVLGLALIALIAKILMLSNQIRSAIGWLGRNSLYLFALELPIAYTLAKCIPILVHPMFAVDHMLWIEPIRMMAVGSCAIIGLFGLRPILKFLQRRI